MKLLALGLTAAIAAGAALSATPAAAGAYIEYYGPRHYYAPPPPPPPLYRPAPVFYAPAPRPERICTIRYVRDWGYWGPTTRRVETCRDRW